MCFFFKSIIYNKTFKGEEGSFANITFCEVKKIAKFYELTFANTAHFAKSKPLRRSKKLHNVVNKLYLYLWLIELIELVVKRLLKFDWNFPICLSSSALISTCT